MTRVYEVSYGPGYARGTRKQVSRALDALGTHWFGETDHLHAVALGQEWARLPPSRREAWLAQGERNRREDPELPEHASTERAAWTAFGATATLEWQERIGRCPWPPAVPWTVRADTDKAHRCPRCQTGGGTQQEIARTGGRVTRWHVYRCTRCGQRFARWPVPLLPEYETGNRVFWRRLRHELRWRARRKYQDVAYYGRRLRARLKRALLRNPERRS